MTFDSATLEMLKAGLFDTLFMVFLSSFFAYLIGIPLGIILVVTDKEGIYPIPWLQKVLGIAINLLRSIPFIILLILVLPFTEFLLGTTLGAKAVVPPLVIAAAPYVARMVESSFREVDGGVIEAAKSMGASTMQIVWKVLLPEAKPSLLVGAAISITTILGYSTMAGFTGGGGLGDIAIRYGYYRYETGMMLVTVAVLVIIVQIIQEAGIKWSKKSDKRIR
ncbi:MAG TPA: ABC transporter permease [Candidatus Hungatella pullicola]|nr:ABC transporter permease [Candidatus Hungatella pullicola]